MITIFAWKNELWKRWKACNGFTWQHWICYINKKFETSIKVYIVLRKVCRVIQFNQNFLLKLYIDMNADLRFERSNFWTNCGKCEKT